MRESIGRVGGRLAHVDLGGQVEDDLGRRAPDQVAHRLGVADVELDELGAGADRAVEVLAPAGREVVENGHLVAPLEQGVDEVRADEAGAARDQ